jgi:hypothetical protein
MNMFVFVWIQKKKTIVRTIIKKNKILQNNNLYTIINYHAEYLFW